MSEEKVTGCSYVKYVGRIIVVAAPAIAAKLGTFKILWTYMCATSVASVIPALIVMWPEST